MWTKMKKAIVTAAAVVASAGLFTTSQAYALNDDETAILVGVATGGLAAIATKHHLDHDRWDRQSGGYREYHYYERERPVRVEHYVVHEPPRYREYEYERRSYRGGHGHGHHRGHHRGRGRGHGGGYEYVYERRSGF